MCLDWMADMMGLRRNSIHRQRGGVSRTAPPVPPLRPAGGTGAGTKFMSNEKGCDGRLVAILHPEPIPRGKAVKIAALDGRTFGSSTWMKPSPPADLLAEQVEKIGRRADSLLRLRHHRHNLLHAITLPRSGRYPAGRICFMWRPCWAGSRIPEFRYLQEGIEIPDSYCFNPTK